MALLKEVFYYRITQKSTGAISGVEDLERNAWSRVRMERGMREKLKKPKSVDRIFGIPRWLLLRIGAGIIALVGVYAAVGADQLRGLLQGWLNACSVIIEVSTPLDDSKDSGKALLVKLNVLGRSQIQYDVFFSTSGSEDIQTVELLRDPQTRNLTFHPDSGTFCPEIASATDAQPARCKGLLTPFSVVPAEAGSSEPSQSYSTVGWKIDGLDGALDYRFKVRLRAGSALMGKDLFVYAVPVRSADIGADAGICRFESLSAWNFVATLSNFFKLLLASVVVFVLAAIAMTIQNGKEP